MSYGKGAFESSMGRIGSLATGHPGKVTAAFVLVTLVMLVPLAGLQTQSNMSDFMPENEFADARDAMVDQFDSAYPVMTVISSGSGDVLSREGLLALQDMEERILASGDIVPYLADRQDPVMSIADAVEGGLRLSSNGTLGISNAPDDVLESATIQVLSMEGVGSLASRGEGTQREHALLVVLTEYGRYSAALADNDESMDAALESAISEGLPDGYESRTLGGFSSAIQDDTMKDLSVLLPASMLVLVLILLAALRSAGDLAISLVGLASTLVISFGLFVLLGLPFNQMTFFAPIYILVLSVDFAIHVLLRYREEREGDGVVKAMPRAVRFVGVSVTLSALTTMVAFASNGFSSIPAVASFGLFIALGIAVSYLVMIVFVPSMKVLSERRRERAMERKGLFTPRGRRRSGSDTPGPGRSRRGLVRAGRAAYSHPVLVLLLVAGLTVGGFLLAMQLENGLSYRDILAEDSDKIEAFDIIEGEFEGNSPNRIYVMATGDVTDPGVLSAMDEVLSNMADTEGVEVSGGTPRAVSVLVYMRALLGSGMQIPGVEDANGDLIPDTGQGVEAVFGYLLDNGIPGAVPTQEVSAVLSAGEGRGTYDALLITVEAGDIEGSETGRLLDDIRDDVAPLEELDGVEVSLASSIFETHEVNLGMTGGMLLSTMVSIVICGLIVILLFRSVKFGALAAVPVVIVTVWILGTTYLLGYDLNPVTATTTAMTVGIGIDYSIHLVERYRQERRRTGSFGDAMDVAVGNTGAALLAAAATTAAGFAIISLSRIGMFKGFGILAALIVVYVLAASLFVLPAFIALAERAGAWASRRHGVRDGKAAKS